jgi:hypothetical protein
MSIFKNIFVSKTGLCGGTRWRYRNSATHKATLDSSSVIILNILFTAKVQVACSGPSELFFINPSLSFGHPPHPLPPPHLQFNVTLGTFLSVGTGDSFPGGEAAGAWSWPLTSIQCLGQRKSVAIPLLPQYAFVVWCKEKHIDKFTFIISMCFWHLCLAYINHLQVCSNTSTWNVLSLLYSYHWSKKRTLFYLPYNCSSSYPTAPCILLERFKQDKISCIFI